MGQGLGFCTRGPMNAISILGTGILCVYYILENFKAEQKQFNEKETEGRGKDREGTRCTFQGNESPLVSDDEKVYDHSDKSASDSAVQ